MNALPDLLPGELTQTDTDTEVQVKHPRMYKVIISNDDYTPMNFVVEILEHFFHMDNIQATEVMMRIHLHGSAVCGIFSKDVAETKALIVNEYARAHQYPLLCEAVPESDPS